MIINVIKKLCDKQSLAFEEAVDLIDYLSEGKATPSQIGAFLVAITMKGPTVEEMTAFASRLREKSLRIEVDAKNLIDGCGTGGDLTNTFNISTTAAIVTASSGLQVAKHANFGITSGCGSSNVLVSLGIDLVNTPEDALKQLKKNNITFIHAPYFHKAMSCVNPLRKEIGIRTIFNFIGPLINPACPTGQVLGVSSATMAPILAEVLKNLGTKRALVVHGVDPMIDEINICGETKVYRLQNEQIDSFTICPEDFGIKRANLEDLKGSTPDENAQLIKNIFEGKVEGACLDAVAINAAAMLWSGEKIQSLEEGLKLAYDLIQNCNAMKELKKLMI